MVIQTLFRETIIISTEMKQTHTWKSIEYWTHLTHVCTKMRVSSNSLSIYIILNPLPYVQAKFASGDEKSARLEKSPKEWNWSVLPRLAFSKLNNKINNFVFRFVFITKMWSKEISREWKKNIVIVCMLQTGNDPETQLSCANYR